MLQRIAERQKRPLHFSTSAIKWLNTYHWPGNIRELENFIERLGVLEDGPEIGESAIPDYIRNPDFSTNNDESSSSHLDLLNLHVIERETIKKALNKTNGNRSKAAELLGFSVRTLRNKLNEYKNTGNLTRY